jgi:hypothetical protein
MAAKSKPWDSQYTDKQYQEVLEQAIHFTGKGINSNATAGIRLGHQDYITDLPYVAVCTLPKNSELLDYIGSASIARIFSQGMAAKLLSSQQLQEKFIEDLEEEKNAIQNSIQLAQKAVENIDFNKRYEHPENESINLRLRQIILQDQNGNDIAITPLPSSGFSELLQSKIKEIEDVAASDSHEELKPKKQHLFGKSHHNIGGGNTQNIGGRIYSMQELLFFRPPSENQELKKAYRVFHRGIRLDIPQSLLKNFYSWRDRLLKKYQVMPHELKYRQEEKEYIQKIAQVILDRANEAVFLLQKYQDQFAKKKSTLDVIQQGLIDPSLRDATWREAFASKIYSNILNTEFKVKQKDILLPIDESSGQRWQDYILEVFHG